MTDIKTNDDLRSLIQDATLAVRDGDSQRARQLLMRALELDPVSTEAILGLARLSDDLDEREKLFERVLQSDANNPYAIAGLAEVRRQRRRQQETAEQLEQERLQASQPVTATFCYIHPDRETGLRCTNCSRPICSQCARPAAVGQLCPECMRARTPPNYRVGLREILIAVPVAAVVSFAMALLVLLIRGIAGFFFFLLLFLFGAALIEGIVRAVEWATKNKRGRSMQLAVGAGIALGVGPLTLISFLIAPQLGLVLLLFMIFAIVMTATRLR